MKIIRGGVGWGDHLKNSTWFFIYLSDISPNAYNTRISINDVANESQFIYVKN